VPWWTQRERSGGQVVEQATHLLDVMLDLVGDVEHVYAMGARTERPAFPEADVDDVTAATLRFAGGAVGSLAATALLPAKARAGLELVADGLRLELTETTLTVQDAAGQEVHEDSGEAKVRVDRAFVDAVRGEGDDVRAPYATALRTHRVACALAESAAAASPSTSPRPREGRGRSGSARPARRRCSTSSWPTWGPGASTSRRSSPASRRAPS
jgi:predicted dehydrogenase